MNRLLAALQLARRLYPQGRPSSAATFSLVACQGYMDAAAVTGTFTTDVPS
ncbi:hypothetical protein ACGFMK_01315 [Amycolatopsis sp. NPDC049252]|uniref:hypothetical protein n=1 Tax=Amycolatopsis sp. NPDC049252 TaxID=3363933 RepID=UPI003718992A